MNFPDESAAQSARERLAEGCETMRKLIRGLLDPKRRVAPDVHAIRKLGKSLRGGFKVLGSKSSAKEIQMIGRILASTRDAVSRQKAWQRLGWKHDATLAATISALLKQQKHAASRRPPKEIVDWCEERIDAAVAAVPAGELAPVIAAGLGKLERKLRKRCEQVKQGRSGDFHELRKAVKAWMGALSILPKGEFPLDPALPELAARLGDENDLSVLLDFLKVHGFTKRFAPNLWLAISDSMEKLQEETRKLI